MHPPNDPDHSTDEPPTEPDDRRSADQPICRVFAGPTSHRVQRAGPESRPATSTDGGDNRRSDPADGQGSDPGDGDRPPTDEPPADADFRTGGGRAIAAVLERRLATLEAALDPVRSACWRGEPPDVADLRTVRTGLAELQIAVEEHLARVSPRADPWESAGEHVPEARLVELLERGGGVECLDKRLDCDDSSES